MNDELKHPITIKVNGRDKPWDEKEISYTQVAALAFPVAPDGGNVEYTITYQDAQGNKSGTLKVNGSVHVKDGMIFNVTPTDLS